VWDNFKKWFVRHRKTLWFIARAILISIISIVVVATFWKFYPALPDVLKCSFLSKLWLWIDVEIALPIDQYRNPKFYEDIMKNVEEWAKSLPKDKGKKD
jgi:hypothetical protein